MENKFALFFTAFILNFIWENLHFPLYAGNSIGISNFYLLMLYASLIDAFWILAVFSLVSLVNGGYSRKLNFRNSFLFSILLVAIAFFIEKSALSSGRWSYSDAMPLVFGLGISPLLQLLITGWISMVIIKTINKK